MKAEQQLLQFANQVAPGFTPALLHIDPVQRCVILENVEGKTFTEGIPPTSQAVEDAVKFIYMLNTEPEIARKYIKLDAAEGFLSLREHLTNVQERFQAMNCEHLPKDKRSDAKRLIRQISAKYAIINDRTEELITKGVISDCIDVEKRCVSPSDFGFHNAIETPTGIRFFDFEFSGWDDPAKATIDFLLQPRIPVVGFGMPLLTAWPLKLQHEIKERCYHLEPILRLKWVCILLAVLNPNRLIEIRANTPKERQELLIQERFVKAARLITLVG